MSQAPAPALRSPPSSNGIMGRGMGRSYVSSMFLCKSQKAPFHQRETRGEGQSWSSDFFKSVSNAISSMKSFLPHLFSQGAHYSPSTFSTQVAENSFFITGVELIYNVVLVSGVQQSDSVIRTHIYIFFSDSFPLWVLIGY